VLVRFCSHSRAYHAQTLGYLSRTKAQSG
jgi:hypothetical protein